MFKKYSWIIITFIIVIASLLLFKTLDNGTESYKTNMGTRLVLFNVKTYNTEVSYELGTKEKLFFKDSEIDAKIVDVYYQEDYAIITIEARVYFRGPFMNISNQTIKIGKEYKIKTETYELDGKIVNIRYLDNGEKYEE